MPEIVKSQFELEVERAEQLQEIALAKEAEERKREHEFKIARLKYSVNPRYKTFERGVVVLVKLPALPIALVCITVLVSKGREVPQQLLDFLTV